MQEPSEQRLIIVFRCLGLYVVVTIIRNIVGLIIVSV